MLIDGKNPIATGTVVVRTEESAEILVGGQRLPIRFANAEGGARAEFSGDGALTLVNFNNALGSFAGFTAAVNGQPVQGTIAAYFMNTDHPDRGVRVIHYTIVSTANV